ncbi:hypothetical protein BS78_01G018100 [Paspalum vaginatum]|nr:hypothetical protein BS78_01G018100 [Paspalum vaginatum]
MKGMRCCDCVVYLAAAIFLFLVLLAPRSAQCGRVPQLFDHHEEAASNLTTSPSESSNESEIVLVFCHPSSCGPQYVDCYCCLSQPDDNNCYFSMDECRAHCLRCAPKCPTTTDGLLLGANFTLH